MVLHMIFMSNKSRKESLQSKFNPFDLRKWFV